MIEITQDVILEIIREDFEIIFFFLSFYLVWDHQRSTDKEVAAWLGSRLAVPYSMYSRW